MEHLSPEPLPLKEMIDFLLQSWKETSFPPYDDEKSQRLIGEFVSTLKCIKEAELKSYNNV